VILISVQGVLGSFLQYKARVLFALPNPLLCIHCLQCVVTYLDWGHHIPSFKSPNCCHSDTRGPDCRDSPHSVHILWATWHFLWRATPATVLIRGKLSKCLPLQISQNQIFLLPSL